MLSRRFVSSHSSSPSSSILLASAPQKQNLPSANFISSSIIITTPSPVLFILFCERAQEVFLRASSQLFINFKNASNSKNEIHQKQNFYDSLINSNFPKLDSQTLNSYNATANNEIENNNNNNSSSLSSQNKILLELAEAAKNLLERVSLTLLKEVSSKNISSDNTMVAFNLPKLLKWAKHVGEVLSTVSSSSIPSGEIISPSFVRLMEYEITRRRRQGNSDDQILSLIFSWMNLMHVEQLGHLWSACVKSSAACYQNNIGHRSNSILMLDKVSLEIAQRLKKTINSNNGTNHIQASRSYCALSSSLIAPCIEHLSSSLTKTTTNNSQQAKNHQREIGFHLNKLLSCMKHASSEKDVHPILFSEKCQKFFKENPESAAFALQSLGPSSELWKEQLSQEFVDQVYQLVLTCVEEIRRCSSSTSSSSSSSLQQQQNPNKNHVAKNETDSNVRLYIGVRNGAKILHVAKDYIDLAELYDKSGTPSIAATKTNIAEKSSEEMIKKFFTSWHISDALLQVGRPFDAARSIDDFFTSTRHLFLERLPKAIQQVVFNIASALGRIGATDDAILLLESSCRWDLPTLRPANVLRSVLQGAEEELTNKKSVTSSDASSNEKKKTTNGVDLSSILVHFDVRKIMKWSAATPGVMTVPAAQIAALKLAIYEDSILKNNNLKLQGTENNNNNNEQRDDDDDDVDIFGNNNSIGSSSQTSKKKKSSIKSALQDVLESICAKSVSYHTEDIQNELFSRVVRAMISCNQIIAACQVLVACTENERGLLPLSLFHLLKQGFSQNQQLPQNGNTFVDSQTLFFLQHQATKWLQNAKNRKATEREEKLLQDENDEVNVDENQTISSVGEVKNDRTRKDELIVKLQRSWNCPSCSTANKNTSESCWRCSTLRDPAWFCESCTAFNIVPQSTIQKGKILLREREIMELNNENNNNITTTSATEAFIEKIPCVSCQVCGFDRPVLDDQNVSNNDEEQEESTTWAIMSNLTAVSPWTCHSCNTSNSTSHPHFCTKCGKTNPLMPKIESFACKKCNFVNDRGMLRPWCAQCGTLHENVLLGGKHSSSNNNNKNENQSGNAHLWSCDTCAMLVPWIVNRCTGCRSPKPTKNSQHHQNHNHHNNNNEFLLPTASTTSTLSAAATVAWKTWDCNFCSTTNPPWTSTCRECRKSSSCSLVPQVQDASDENKNTIESTNSPSTSSGSARCKTCGFVELADLRRKGHWCSQCGSALYRAASTQQNNSNQMITSNENNNNSSMNVREFWFLPMIESSLKNQPIPSRNINENDGVSITGQEDNKNISSSAAATSVSLPIEHPQTKETLMWICSNPSLCLTANLISESKCRRCGSLRNEQISSSSSLFFLKNSNNVNSTRFKLADDYLFAPETKNPYYFQLMSTRIEHQHQREEIQRQRQGQILLGNSHQTKVTNEEDDDFAVSPISQIQSSSLLLNQGNNNNQIMQEEVEEEEEKTQTKDLIQKLDATSNSIPPLLVRSFSQACPTCNNNNNNSSSSTTSSYWCDARSLCGFCYNCYNFSCPLPEPILLGHDFGVEVGCSHGSNANKKYYEKLKKKSSSEHPDQGRNSHTEFTGDDDRSLRLWAALKLTHSILHENVIEKSNHNGANKKNLDERKIQVVEGLVKLLFNKNNDNKQNVNNNNNTNQRLPWQGYDISLRAFPDSPREPVVLCVDPLTKDDVLERPHQALKGFVDEILMKLVDMSNNGEIISKSSELLELRKRILESCLSLISVVNSSCDFDELGFETLVEVAKLFRGIIGTDQQREKSSGVIVLPEKVERRLKILYLSQMKLEPRDLVGDKFCWKCLNSSCCVCQEGKGENKKQHNEKIVDPAPQRSLSSFGNKKQGQENIVVKV